MRGATGLLANISAGFVPALLENEDCRAEQVIACLAFFVQQGMAPFAIVCPSSRMELWASTLQRLAPSLARAE